LPMKLDIIVPTYNRRQILAETLASVRNQTYPHWECWISEDGETSETFRTVEPFLDDDRFHYLPGPHAGTPAAPRNRAIGAGQAPYIAFLDDDDLWLPEKLEQQMGFFKKHPDCVLLGCNAYVWPGGALDDGHNLPLYFNKAPFGRVAYRELVTADYLINSSVVISRSVLRYSGLQNETLFDGPDGEDYELWLRAGVLGEIWLLETPLMFYREMPSKKADVPPRKARRKAAYHTKFKIYKSVIDGVGEMPSPLTYPEYENLGAICRRESDFCGKGPRFLGRLRHDIGSAIKRLFPFKTSKIQKEKETLDSFARCKAQWGKQQNSGQAHGVVFSKDRALQLHGLLSSYLEQVSPLQPITVLYDASTDSHRQAYEAVIDTFQDVSIIEFVDQKDSRPNSVPKDFGQFKAALLNILLASKAGKVFFLVDDLVFIEPVNMDELLLLDTERFVPSMRMGVNLSKCYVVNKNMPLPEFMDAGDGASGMVSWEWSAGELDWGYPLSVDGHLFDRREIAAMAALLSFSAPNSFEDRLQLFRPFFKSRQGIAYRKSRIVNIPCNRVQNEINNRFGVAHQDDLLEKWHNGYQMDYQKLYGFNNDSVHQEVHLSLQRRK